MLIPPLKELHLCSVSDMTDTECMLLFKSWRWQDCDPLNMNDAECPHCTGRKVKYYSHHKRWKCQNPKCRKLFSLTSGTAFSYHKLSFKQILIFLILYTSTENTISSCELARQLGITQKNSYLLKMKINDVLLQTLDLSKMSGNIQIDGCYKTSSKRVHKPLPKEEYKKVRESKKEQARCIIVMNESSKNAQKKGSHRTLFTIAKDENSETILPFAQRFISPNSEIWTDGHSAYKNLIYQYKHGCVHHNREYKSKDGVHNNYCESFNSRFRQCQQRVHKISNHYLHYYVAEVVYRHDKRSLCINEKIKDIVQRIFSLKPLRDWMNYHRSKRIQVERLGMAFIQYLEEKQKNIIKPLYAIHCQ